MKLTPIACCLTTAISILAIPASASAVEIHKKTYVDRGPLIREVERVIHVAPPDSDDDGFANQYDDCPQTSGTVMGCPPEPGPTASSSSDFVASAPAEPVYESSGTTSAGGCPSYMAGEATSPDAVNPTSGAAGCFQIIPSTQAAHGCAAPDAACAAAICATQGDDAWVAADPCAYLGTEP